MSDPSPPGESGRASLLAAAGAILVFIGGYVPWVVTTALFSDLPVRGVETPWGRRLLLLPLAALGLLAWQWYVRRARWVHAVILVLGAMIVGVALAYAVQVRGNLARARESLAASGQLPGAVNVRFDVGLYLTVVGGAALILGGGVGIRESRRSKEK